jgi:hypothetical protein
MNDDRQDRGDPERRRIDVDDPDEIRHWTRTLAVTEGQLRDAVKAVGSQATEVRAFLGKTVARP